MAVHDLAGLCGLNVPEARLDRFSSLGSTYLCRRFDRIIGKRVHFASAMTLLGKTDGASAVDGTSYLDIADFIRSYGAQQKKTCWSFGSALFSIWLSAIRMIILAKKWGSVGAPPCFTYLAPRHIGQ